MLINTPVMQKISITATTRPSWTSQNEIKAKEGASSEKIANLKDAEKLQAGPRTTDLFGTNNSGIAVSLTTHNPVPLLSTTMRRH